MFSLWLNVISTMALLFSALERLKPIFGPELFLIVSVTGALSYTGLPAAALKQRVGAASKPE